MNINDIKGKNKLVSKHKMYVLVEKEMHQTFYILFVLSGLPRNDHKFVVIFYGFVVGDQFTEWVTHYDVTNVTL